MYKLCITEKPIVAKSIATVIGANIKKNGYYIGNGYIVTYCIGHLVGLAEPEYYGKQYELKNFNRSLLPIIPEKFKTVVLDKTKEQFLIVKELINREDIEMIIDAGDNDPQGFYLQWLVREKAGCKKTVKKLLIDDYTERVVLNGMKNLKDIELYSDIIKSEFCKAKEDWILGMSFSRWYFSPFGRVQSPTLNFVVLRYLIYKNFKSIPYYQVEALFKEGFSCLWTMESNNRIENKNEANEIAERIQSIETGTITKLETDHKTNSPPQLYNIDELEKDGVNMFGYAPNLTLKAAQTLYEKYKITTYPRAESQYITEELAQELKVRITELRKKSPYDEIMQGRTFDGFTNRVVDSSKIEAHHAIIVTEKIKDFDFSTIKESDIELENAMKNILHMIISRILISLSSKYEYDETALEVTVGKDILCTKEKFTTNLGYKAIQNKLLKNTTVKKQINEKEKVVLMKESLKINQIVKISGVNVLNKLTTAPPLHTEATLLAAMENASNSIENNEEEKAAIKNLGIGTKSTRAGIIAKLFNDGYIKYEGTQKVKSVVPTEKGLKLIEILPEELKTAALTADCELKLQKIRTKEITESTFMNEIIKFVNDLFDKLHEEPNQTIFSNDSTFINNKESLGKCPYCGSPVYEGNNNFYCEKHILSDLEKRCPFQISKINEDKNIILKRTKAPFIKEAMKALLMPRGLTTTCVSEEKGCTYRANFKINPNFSDKYHSVQFDMIFVNKNKRSKK